MSFITISLRIQFLRLIITNYLPLVWQPLFSISRLFLLPICPLRGLRAPASLPVFPEQNNLTGRCVWLINKFLFTKFCVFINVNLIEMLHSSSLYLPFPIFGGKSRGKAANMAAQCSSKSSRYRRVACSRQLSSLPHELYNCQ